MTTPSKAPVREIGYANPYIAPANWWMYEGEQTPELQWPQSVVIYDAMRTQDAQVKSVLDAVTLPVRRTPWRLDPAGARPEVVQLVAEDLGLPILGQDPKPLPRTRDRFAWKEHLREALLMLPFGHMYFEQVYRIDDSGRARLRKLATRMPKTIEQIDVARDGGLISIRQYRMLMGLDDQPDIPVSRLVAYIHDKEGGNWLGRSVLRAAYKNWLIKDRLLRVQAQTIERNGMGIPVYTGPPGASADDIAKGAAMAQAWRSGENSGTGLPNEAKMELVGVSGTLPDSDPAIRYHDEQIARAVLAHFLNLGTETGSWALGTTFADFFTLSLQTLAQSVADIASQHIVEDIVDLNWGEEEPAPRVVFDEIGSRQEATAASLKSLFDAGALTADDVLEHSLRQQYGLPPADKKTARTAPAQQGPAPRTAPETQSDERPGSVAASAAVETAVEAAVETIVEGVVGGVVEQLAIPGLEPDAVTAHLKGLHDQRDHGRRFHVPGKPSSGVRPNRAQREAATSARELDELKQSLTRAAAAFQSRSDRQAGAGAKSTSAPSRMTKAGYTKILKAEQVRLLMLDGKTEKKAKALTRPTMSIDDLKARNTEMRKALRRKGVDYRTEEQKRADDAEKNALLDEAERLAAEGGHDPVAKRAGASRMSKQELAKFVADVKDYQRRQKAKAEAPSKAAFEQVEADSLATPRQVGYIVSLLRERAKSGEGGGFMNGPTETAEIRKMSKREASAYINSLRGDY